jgi:hypothetical protein
MRSKISAQVLEEAERHMEEMSQSMEIERMLMRCWDGREEVNWETVVGLGKWKVVRS